MTGRSRVIAAVTVALVLSGCGSALFFPSKQVPLTPRDLGLLYDETGKRDKALDVFKRIYEVDYGYRDVAKRVEDSYRK